MKRLLLVSSVLLGMALAQDSVIYRGFAELRQPVNLPAGAWTWAPGQNLFQSLVPGTLKLSGVIEQSRQIQTTAVIPPLVAYQGKDVSFFWEGQWRTAKVVDASRNLFLFEKRYLVGLPGVVAYPDGSGFQAQPGPKVIFRYQGSGAAKLSYLTRGLSWTLRYTLEEGELTGWATLTNSLGTALKLGNTQVVAGAVPLLEGEYNAPSPAAITMQMRSRAAEATEMDAAEFFGEAGGTFRYQLPGDVVAEPGLTELPFIRTKVVPIYFWRYQGGLSQGRLNFERGYRFDAPENLAAGAVSLREQGVFVGQAGMSDTGKGGLVRLSLGPDPDGRADRKFEQIAKDRFRVTTTYRNPRSYPIEIEVIEFIPQPFTLDFNEAEKTPEGYRLTITLKPAESRVLVYTLTMPR
jgi:hypothetical protein